MIRISERGIFDMLALATHLAGRWPIGAYLRFEVRRQLRNRRFVIITVALPVSLYVLYTAVLDISSSATIDGRAWPVFFLVSMAAYGAMAAAITQANAIAAERGSGWSRQLRVTPLSRSSYVLTKLATAVLLTAPALVFVAEVAIIVNHVELPVRVWIELVLALSLGSLPFAALAILLGYTLGSESVQGAVTLTFFGLAILGGLFAPADSFPPALATIAHVLPSYHLAALGRDVVASGVPDPVDVIVLTAYALAFGGLAAWRYRAVEQRSHGG